MITRWRCEPCKTWFSEFEAELHTVATGHRLSVSVTTHPVEPTKPTRAAVSRHRPLLPDAQLAAFLRGLDRA